jgi:hypothetical protein
LQSEGCAKEAIEKTETSLKEQSALVLQKAYALKFPFSSKLFKCGKPGVWSLME